MIEGRSAAYPKKKNIVQKYSYGVLLYSAGQDLASRRYLIIQNRDTEAFIYFFLAWNMEKWTDYYFLKVIRGFSRDELNRLLFYPFDILYTDLYVSHKPGTFQKQYDRALSNYRYFHSRSDWIHMCHSVTTSEIQWGFSKGRIEMDEEPVQCALRELEEETGIPPTDLTLFEDRVIRYVNEKNLFKTMVHVALFPASCPAPLSIRYSVFPNTIRCVSVSNEILHARWATLAEAFHLLPTHLYRLLYEFHISAQV